MAFCWFSLVARRKHCRKNFTRRVILTPGLWTSDFQNCNRDTFLLFEATKFLAICYDRHRKLIECASKSKFQLQTSFRKYFSLCSECRSVINRLIVKLSFLPSYLYSAAIVSSCFNQVLLTVVLALTELLV